MPELPEVEVTRRGLAPALVGRTVTGAAVRCPALRGPVPDLAGRLAGRRLAALRRRGKYLIWEFVSPAGDALRLVSHMGMSGSWRIWDAPAPEPRRHDHVDLVFGDRLVRYTDPRRFGSMFLTAGDPESEPPLNALGREPWDPALTPESFREALRRTRRPIKAALLDGRIVVGCGNIYCSEALFAAGIRPTRRADSLSPASAARLLAAVREVLERAVASGGSTLSDFHGVAGQSGWFQLSAAVYDREGEPCPKCGGPVRRIVQNGRGTFWCPRCQH